MRLTIALLLLANFACYPSVRAGASDGASPAKTLIAGNPSLSLPPR